MAIFNSYVKLTEGNLFCIFFRAMEVSLNGGGTPLADWFIHQNPVKTDDLVGTPILGNLYIFGWWRSTTPSYFGLHQAKPVGEDGQVKLLRSLASTTSRQSQHFRQLEMGQFIGYVAQKEIE